MTTCGTCKYWKQPNPEDFDLSWVEDSELEPSEKARKRICETYGLCKRIVHRKRDAHITDPAFATDVSDYHGSLRCREDFGCTLYEKEDGIRLDLLVAEYRQYYAECHMRTAGIEYESVQKHGDAYLFVKCRFIPKQLPEGVSIYEGPTTSIPCP